MHLVIMSERLAAVRRGGAEPRQPPAIRSAAPFLASRFLPPFLALLFLPAPSCPFSCPTSYAPELTFSYLLIEILTSRRSSLSPWRAGVTTSSPCVAWMVWRALFSALRGQAVRPAPGPVRKT